MADPVAWWKFDETSGSSAADSSGNGNTATLYGTPTWGDGVALDGTDYIGVSTSSTTNATGDFTISLWLKTSQAGASDQYPIVIMKDGGFPRNGYGIYLHESTADAKWFGEIRVGGTGYGVDGATDVADGEWHHLVFQREGSTLRTYEDGALANTLTAVSTTITNSAELRFGKSTFGYGYDYYLAGSWEDARIYNVALTSGEIAALYSPSVTLTPPTGAATAVGNAPSITQTKIVVTGAISASGNMPARITTAIVAAGGLASAAGGQPARALYLATASTAVTAAGNAPAATRAIAPATGTASAAGAQPAASLTLGPSSGAATASGSAPELVVGQALVPQTGEVQAIGGAVARSFFLAPASGLASGAGATAPALSLTLTPGTGVATAAGNAPELDLLDPFDLTPPTGNVLASGNQPTLTFTYVPPSGRGVWIGNQPQISGKIQGGSICTPPLLNRGMKIMDVVAYLA